MTHILKNNYFELLQKDLKSINPGCDMLVINLSQPIRNLDTILNMLDSDNSETASFSTSLMDFTVNKIETGEFKICDLSTSIDDTAYKVMQYRVQKSKQKQIQFKLYWQLTFYSTLFRIIELGHIPYKNIIELVEEVFENEKHHVLQSSISRYDYKIDFIYSQKPQFPLRKDLINDPYKRKNEDYYRVFSKWEYTTGRKIGSRSNKSYLIRLYDKNEDTRVKNKRHLYGEYLSSPAVLRLEGEFHTKFMKDENKVPFTLRSIEKLEHKARFFFQLEQSNELKWFLHQYRKKDIDILNIIENLPYIKTTLSRLLKISQGGVNPFTLFVKKGWIESVIMKLPAWTKELNHYVETVLLPKLKKNERKQNRDD